jgi:hypothetical protein
VPAAVSRAISAMFARAVSGSDRRSASRGHIAGLLAEANPDLDADLHAYLIIAAFHSPAVLDLLDQGEADRLARALRRSAAALLDAPGGE